MGCACSTTSSNTATFAPGIIKQCDATLPCGHTCAGVAGELEHFGCADPECEHNGPTSPCPICLDEISSSPAVRLECTHAVHVECIQAQLRSISWRGKEVKTAELRCPSGCGQLIRHPALQTQALERVVEGASRAALQQAASDGVDAKEAEAKYRVYQCDQCVSPYVGGLRQCGGAAPDETAKALCDGCRAKSSGLCKKHGAEFTAYKCNYCCQVATFTCGGGGERFCTTCHIGAAKMFHEGRWPEWQRGAIAAIPKCDPATCPFGGAHPAGRTHAWHSWCSKCYLASAAAATTAAATTGAAARKGSRKAPKKCETPGCTLAVAAEAAGWNALGRHCCAGCMKHGSYATMGRNPAPPPHACHDGRCARKAWTACMPCE